MDLCISLRTYEVSNTGDCVSIYLYKVSNTFIYILTGVRDSNFNIWETLNLIKGDNKNKLMNGHCLVKQNYE